MKTRLSQLMKQYNLTASRFADRVGVQRSSISHILSGRNQPSYDFILKLMEKFPELNAAWLLKGEGDMLKAEKGIQSLHYKKTADIQQTEVKNLWSQTLMHDQAGMKQEGEIKGSTNVTNVNTIQRIIFFYRDGTFEEYMPRKED
jgi:transcriptional regulator with XRE-family HTH domain